MATLVPALGSCTARMTNGERRLAERLEHKLDGDYLLWYDVPLTPERWYAGSKALGPQRGLLIWAQCIGWLANSSLLGARCRSAPPGTNQAV